MPQIICENASLGYENRPIVKNLSFTVNAGDYLCILVRTAPASPP